jgi:hypothetical protein
MPPIQTAQAQVLAYNTRNIDDFAALHAPNVQLFNFGETKPFASGRDQVKAIYGDIFANSPELNAEIINRIVMGKTIIDHEVVTGRKGVDRLEIIAIFQVEKGMIQRGDFIRK